MKKKVLWSLLTVLVAGFTSVGLTSCQEPEEVGPNGGTTNPDKTVPDPEGTIFLSMRDYDNGKTMIDDCIYIYKENWKGNWNFLKSYFVSVGEVKGLGNVETIPTMGWAESVGVLPGNGYVAYNTKENMFYRIYVVDYVVNTSGGIMGAEVKYQAPFKGKTDEAITLETNSLSLAYNESKRVAFTNSAVIPFKATSSESWCNVTSATDLSNSSLSQGIQVLVGGKNASGTATITIETLFGKKTTLTVTAH